MAHSRYNWHNISTPTSNPTGGSYDDTRETQAIEESVPTEPSEEFQPPGAKAPDSPLFLLNKLPEDEPSSPLNFEAIPCFNKTMFKPFPFHVLSAQ